MPAQQSEIDAQKAALLASIAQQGSQGQAAFNAEASRRQAAQQAAVGAIAQRGQMTGISGSAPKEFTQQLQGQQNDLGNIYAQDAAMSRNTFNNSIAQTSASNAAYMDQARAAVPVVNAQTQGTVAKLKAQAESEAADRAYQAEQRRLDAIESAKDRAFSEEQRGWDREDRNASDGDKKTADMQDSVVNRAVRTASRPVAEILDTVTKTVDTGNLGDAINFADRYIKDEVEAGGGKKLEGWQKGDRLDLYRYIYEYYTGKPAPKDPNKAAELFQAEGVDPARIPGYVPENQRSKGVVTKSTYKEIPSSTQKDPRKPAGNDPASLVLRRKLLQGEITAEQYAAMIQSVKSWDETWGQLQREKGWNG